MFSSSSPNLQKIFLAFSISLAVLAMNHGASAAVKTWDGDDTLNPTTPSSNWMDGINWDNNTAPNALDSLIFAGTIGLVPNNDFTAGTQFNGISFATGAGAFVLGGNAVNLGGNLVNSSAAAESIVLDLALQQDVSVAVNGGALNIGSTTAGATTGGVISGAFGMIKSGAGTLNLNKINTYTGTTTITSGQLNLNQGIATNNTAGSSANVLASGSTLLAAGGTVTTIGGTGTGTNAYVQSVKLSIGAGSTNLVQTRGSQARVISQFTTLTRAVGGTATFTETINSATNATPGSANANTGGYRTLNTAGTILVGGVIPYIVSLQSNLASSATNNSTSWFVPSATGNGTGNNGAALPFASYTASTATSLGASTANSNVVSDVDLSSGGTVTGTTTAVNTIRFNDPTAGRTVSIGATNTLAVNAGGLLVTLNAGNNLSRITGGTLTGGSPGAGSGQDLIILDYVSPLSGANAVFQIDSTVADAGGVATALTKSGIGTLNLTGANTYTGNTFVNAGTLQANNATGSATGSGAVTVGGGTTTAFASQGTNTLTTIYGAVGGGNGAANGGALSPTTGAAALQTYAPNAVGIISGPVTINAFGHLAPGNVTGLTVASGAAVFTGTVGTLTVASLTLNASVVLDYEFNATANDFTRVTTNGGLTLGGPITVNLFQEGTNTAFTTPGTYNLLGYTGALNGSVSNLSVANAQAGVTYTFNNDVTDGLIQVVVAVPEPSTWMMLASGLGLLVAGRRFRWRMV